jgi:hypothetical protein
MQKQKRQQKTFYLPTLEGGLVRKMRDDLTEKERTFVAAVKGLEGRNEQELQQYRDAAKELFS